MQALQLAEAVRTACAERLVRAYEDAGLQGLCDDGRWEVAVGAMRSLDLRELLEELGVVAGDPA